MGSRNRFKKREDSFSFTPTAGGSLSTEGRRAARRSAGTRRAIAPAAAATSSVVRMGGEEYSMNNPEQKAAYETVQKEELERQRERSPMADIRGGDGLADTGSRMARSAPAPRDPNNTGARGVDMTYDRFMQDIGSAKEGRTAFEVRDPFASENLPGTAGFGASFALNSGANQQSFKEGMAGAQMVDGRIVPKVTINSAEMDRMSSMLENQRQLTPGTEPTGRNSPNFGENQVNIGLKGTGIDTSQKTDNSAENQMLRRRAAFLNASDSLQGLRAAEGEMGLISQGGKKFARDTGAESGLREISQDQYRSRMDGGNMSEIMKPVKDNPIASAAKGKADARLGASGAGSKTAATEAPSDVENPFVIGEDGKTETIDNTSALHGARNSFVKGMNTIPKILNR